MILLMYWLIHVLEVTAHYRFILDHCSQLLKNNHNNIPPTDILYTSLDEFRKFAQNKTNYRTYSSYLLVEFPKRMPPQLQKKEVVLS